MNPLRTIAAAVLIVLLSAGPAGASVSVDEEEVVFRLRAEGAARVYLVGDFNGWNPTVDLMAVLDSVFEIRLYLVPGSYRYRFVADGVSTADPDNPCADADGNSCFTILESPGGLELLLSADSRSERTRERERIGIGGEIRLAARPEEATLGGSVRVAGSFDERASMDCTVGFDARAGDEQALDGASFLARGSAAYDFGGRTIHLFNRSASALAEDGEALPLFGRIGPYDYPAGLMSRGAGFTGRLVGGLDARIVYANRLGGCGCGLEGMASAGDSSAKREMLDADAFGARVEAKAGSARLQALYRLDRRTMAGAWPDPESAGTMCRGYERVEMWGGRIEIPGEEGWRLEGAFMLGGSDRIAAAALTSVADTFAPSSIEREWERGYRFIVGVSRDGARVDARATFARDVIEELAAVAPEHTRENVGGEISYEGGAFEATLAGEIEIYGASGAGNRWWLSAENFWLDGDGVTLDRLPFLSSRELREIHMSLAWRREPFDGLSWGSGTAVDVRHRSGAGVYSPRTVEVRLSNGTFVHPRAALILDMRGVSYGYGETRGDFVAAFLGLHAKIASSCWCLVGCGVAPYAFDRWLWDYAAWGRERYLEERNPFGVLAALGEQAAVRRLLDAEEALADDWLVTLQAGFTF